MYNSKVVLPFFCCRLGRALFGQICSKMSKLSVEDLYLVDSLIQISRIQWCCSLFCFQPEILFLWKFRAKIKIISLNLNLVPSVIPIWGIQWWFLLFLFLIRNMYHFWANLFQKAKVFSLRGNSVLKLIRICRIQWCWSLFGQIWSKKIKIIILSWNLITSVIRISGI